MKKILLKNRSERNDFLISYGSKSQDSDLDLLLVFENENQDVRLISNIEVDLCKIHYTSFLKKIGFYDPCFTEPLLGGDFEDGNFSVFESLKNKLLDSIVDYYSIINLQYHSIFHFLEIKHYLNSEIEINKLHVLENLSFAHSYLAFSDYYLNISNKPLLLKNLISLNRYKTLSLLLNDLKILKSDFSYNINLLEYLNQWVLLKKKWGL